MSGFVWVKTRCGLRTCGFFAFRARDGKLCTSDGNGLDPPSDSVMIQGDELLTAINKSAPKGMYVSDWHVADWNRYLHASNASEEDWAAYTVVNTAVESVDGVSGITSPRHDSKDVVAEKKAGAKARRDSIENDYKESIKWALRLLKPDTVRALALAVALTVALCTCRDVPRPRSRAQSAQVHRFYRRSTEQNQMNTKFMTENRLTRIIFPKLDTYDKMTQIWPKDDEWQEYIKLCNKLNLASPSQMQEDKCQHYVMKRGNKVVAGVSIMTANINNSNKRACVSVELLVSTQKGSAKMFHKIISAYLKKRAGTSYLVTQALDSNKANEFWYKHMARHREADALNFMFFMIDRRYHLYEGVTSLRATF